MSKRLNDNLKLSELLKEFVESNNLQEGLNKVDVKEAWESLMGNGVNNYTTNITLKNKTLYIK